MKRFLILGGYGNTGILIAHLLLKFTSSGVIIAGRNRRRGIEAASKLKRNYPPERVTSVVCDAADKNSLLPHFHNCDFVIAASSTAMYTDVVAHAAIEAGIDYLDVQVSSAKLKFLRSIQNEINNSGLTFITDAGFHPGLPGAMVRYAGEYFDVLEKANVGSLILINWSQYSFSQSTLAEIVEEVKNYSTTVFRDGRWQKVRIFDKELMRDFVFEEPFGKVRAYSMHLEEMIRLTNNYPGLRSTGFYVQGFNWFTNYIVFPFSSAALKIIPGSTPLVAKVMEWSLKMFSKPPYKCILKLEAEGMKNSQLENIDLVISHEDGYFLTAVPIVATLIQYLDGLVKPGLHYMAHYPEPVRLIHDMKHMGLQINSSVELLSRKDKIVSY